MQQLHAHIISLRSRRSRRLLRSSETLTYLLLILTITNQFTVKAQPSDDSQPPATYPAEPSANNNVNAAIALTRELLNEMHCFWSNYGPDNLFGGFHATLDRQGNSISPTAKTLAQQAQHLYFFSAHYAALADKRVAPLLTDTRGDSTAGSLHPGSTACGAYLLTAADVADVRPTAADVQSADRRLADRAHGFLTSHFLDAATGLFATAISPDGNDVIDAVPEMYGNLLAIYALAVYARVFNYDVARNEALAAFIALDARLYDTTYGGYDESKAVQYPKTFNGLLALLQATLELARVAPEHQLVRQRLRECLRLVATAVVATDGPGYGRQYFYADWRPAPDAATAAYGTADDGSRVDVSYGLQLWACWLVQEAVPVAFGGGDDVAAVAARVAGLRLGAMAVHEGYHYGRGGFFFSGLWNSTSAKVWDKTWWVQAEALPALWALATAAAGSAGGEPYTSTAGGGPYGNGPSTYVKYLLETLEWVRQCQSDETYGEWYWLTYGDCSVAATLEAAGAYRYPGDTKGSVWKGPWQNGRALLRLLVMMMDV